MIFQRTAKRDAWSTRMVTISYCVFFIPIYTKKISQEVFDHHFQ